MPILYTKPSIEIWQQYSTSIKELRTIFVLNIIAPQGQTRSHTTRKRSSFDKFRKRRPSRDHKIQPPSTSNWTSSKHHVRKTEVRVDACTQTAKAATSPKQKISIWTFAPSPQRKKLSALRRSSSPVRPSLSLLRSSSGKCTGQKKTTNLNSTL